MLGVKFLVNGFDIVLDIEGVCVNIGIVYVIFLDVVVDQLQLVIISLRGDEMDLQVVFFFVGEIIEKFESIDGFGEFNLIFECCIIGIVVYVNDGSVIVFVDLLYVKFVRFGDGVENFVVILGNVVYQSKVVFEMSVGIGSFDIIMSRFFVSEIFVCVNVVELFIIVVVDF